MSQDAIDKVRRLESSLLDLPQATPETDHLFHAGMYARTVRIPAGAVMTGALIKLATILIVSGDCTVFTGGGESLELTGYHILSGQPGRKQAFIAHTETHLTMIFQTDARTVAEAEDEFTDESGMLLSRREIGITEEM